MGLEISEKDQKWAEETLEKVYAKMEQVREEIREKESVSLGWRNS